MRETCPTFPGRPIYAHWGVPDPALVEAGVKRTAAFQAALHLLAWRIDLMLALRPETLERAVAEHRLRSIVQQVPPTVTTDTSAVRRTD